MEEQRNIVYVVVDQEVTDINYEELYYDSIVKRVYCRDVAVTIPSFNGSTKICQLFSFSRLPKAIISPSNYQDKIRRMNNMMSRVLKNKHNTVIIWTFAIKVDHIGTYLQFIHSLENKGKKLIFHLSAADMEKLTNNVLFNNLSERFVDRGMVEFRQMGN